MDKIDRNIAEIIVQKKYEDIVQYLQDALEASSEDEDNFKNVATELEEKIKKLASSKSDRIEIQPLQESLVKAEASIAKLMSQHREVGKSDEVYSKAEVNQLLDFKVDKESLDDLVNHVIKSRRGKRVPGTALSHIIDDLRMTHSEGGAGGGGGGAMGNTQNEFASDGLSVLHRPGGGTGFGVDDNSIGSSIGAGGGGGGVNGGTGTGGNLRDRSNTAKLEKNKSLGGFPSNTPGVYRAPTEGGKPGGYSEKVSNGTTATATGGGANNGKNASNSVYGNSLYKGVPTGLFPPANGAIILSKSTNDLQIGGGRRGMSGDDLYDDYSPDRMNTGAESPSGQGARSGRLGSPERNASRDEYSFLGATTKGGGFNTRQLSAGKPPVINALSVASKNNILSPDQEG